MTIRTLRPAFYSSIALLVVSCGPRMADDSKRRSVDGHFAHAISGQIGQHGSTFLELQIEVMRARIAATPKDIPARQMLAEALTRLGKHDDAMVVLDELDAVKPNRFETYYQRAVVSEAKGDLEAALAAAESAAELRSSGHDEMGDYYLRMYRWMSARSKGGATGATGAGENFLGLSYIESADSVAESPELKQRYLVALLEENPGFPDGLFVMGDWLASNRRDQLAARAYVRAIGLATDEATKQVITGRLADIEARWKEADESSELIFDPDYRERIEDEFRQAASWCSLFQGVERDLVHSLPAVPPRLADDAESAEKERAEADRKIALLSLKLPTKKDVMAEIRRRSIQGPGYFHVGLVQAKESPFGLITGASPIMWGGVGVALLVFVAIYRYAIRDRSRQRYQL